MSGYFVNAADTSAKEENENSNILIAYFTVPEDIDTNGIDADSGASVVVKDEEVLGIYGVDHTGCHWRRSVPD